MWCESKVCIIISQCYFLVLLCIAAVCIVQKLLQHHEKHTNNYTIYTLHEHCPVTLQLIPSLPTESQSQLAHPLEVKLNHPSIQNSHDLPLTPVLQIHSPVIWLQPWLPVSLQLQGYTEYHCDIIS